jgi:hypothetical protein
MELSLRMDWSAGPSIVAVFILLLVLSGSISGRIGGNKGIFNG